MAKFAPSKIFWPPLFLLVILDGCINLDVWRSQMFHFLSSFSHFFLLTALSSLLSCPLLGFWWGPFSSHAYLLSESNILKFWWHTFLFFYHFVSLLVTIFIVLFICNEHNDLLLPLEFLCSIQSLQSRSPKKIKQSLHSNS